MAVTYHDVVTGSIKLVSVPELYVRIHEAVESPNASTVEIGKIISQDPALTAHLLRIANSPLYGFSNRIDTISRAIMVIGTRGLSALVLAASAVDVFAKIPSDMINMASFWRHSIYSAVIARILANRCNILHSERLFVSGMLHDVGQLITFHKLPEMAREALFRCRDLGQTRYQAERDVMGFDHAQVGGEVLRSWRLPGSIVDAVAYHHEPTGAPDHGLEASITHVATCLASTVEASDPGEHEISACEAAAWDRIGLRDAMAEAILNEARPHFIAALSLFLPKAATAA